MWERVKLYVWERVKLYVREREENRGKERERKRERDRKENQIEKMIYERVGFKRRKQKKKKKKIMMCSRLVLLIFSPSRQRVRFSEREKEWEGRRADKLSGGSSLKQKTATTREGKEDRTWLQLFWFSHGFPQFGKVSGGNVSLTLVPLPSDRRRRKPTIRWSIKRKCLSYSRSPSFRSKKKVLKRRF